jgi:type VI secretion system secreted protein Hcp
MSQEEANQIVRETQRLRRSRRALKLALPTAAALGAGAAIAVGSIPGSDGHTITGCYAGPNGAIVNDVTQAPGALRVIDPSISNPLGAGPSPAAACQTGETQLTWNQSGPIGPQGPTGPTGPQGPGGGQGAAGTPGAPGTPLIGDTSFGLSNNSGQTFLKLDGIKGESSDKTHKDDIVIESFGISAQGNTHGSGGGGGAGKVSIQTFTITKTIDKASPLLFQSAATGKVIKDAVLSFARKAGGKQQDYLKFDFQNVLVSSISDGSSSKQAPTEQVTFAFQKCTETFIGSKGSAQTVSINVGSTLKL